MHKEYYDKSTVYDRLLELQNKSTQDIQMLYQAHDSFKELVKVFEEQLELHRMNSKNVAAHEYSKWACAIFTFVVLSGVGLMVISVLSV